MKEKTIVLCIQFSNIGEKEKETKEGNKRNKLKTRKYWN